jgi:predicted transposase YbfD/YdcC
MSRNAKINQLREMFENQEADIFEHVDVVVIEELADKVSIVSDVRDSAYVRHKLVDVILIVFFAVIAKANTWKDVETFGKSKKKWLTTFLELPYGIPTDDTYRKILSKLNVNYVYGIIIGFLMKKVSAVVALQEDKINGEIKKDKDIIACDGKESKSSKRKETDSPGIKPLNTLNAYSSEWGLCLDQEFIDEKSNEIPAMPILLKRLDLHNAIVTCDALNTQKETVKVIIEGKGDYVLAVKGNQKTLHNDIKDYFEDDVLAAKKVMSDRSNTKLTQYKMTIEKEHSSVVTREYFLETDIGWLYGKKDWKGLKSIGMEHKIIKHNNPKLADSIENRYYICSTVSIDDFARAVRDHWGVENGLHWQLDYSFEDDKNKTTRDNGAKGMQLFKKLGLALLKFAKSVYPKYTSINDIRYNLSLDFEKNIQKIFTILNVDLLKEKFTV